MSIVLPLLTGRPERKPCDPESPQRSVPRPPTCSAECSDFQKFFHHGQTGFSEAGYRAPVAGIADPGGRETPGWASRMDRLQRSRLQGGVL